MVDSGSDGSTEPPDTGSSVARTITLMVIGLVLIGAVLAGVAILGDGADDQPAVDSSAESTGPPETEPPATEPPASGPPATDAPESTAPPETEPSVTEPPVTDPPAAKLGFSIAGIEGDQAIPRRFTCDGSNQSPTVKVDKVPKKTQQLAFLLEDPDAPNRTFVHWVVYGIAPDLAEFGDGRADVLYGLNDVQLLDWFGPCPPEGGGPHGYVFTLFALDEMLALEPGLDGRQLRTAIEPAVLEEASIVATYER